MTVVTTSYLFGHRVTAEGFDGAWRYEDTGLPVSEDRSERRCPKCQQKPTDEDIDPCLGRLPGVTAACCGHGVRPAYIRFSNGATIYFEGVSIVAQCSGL